MRVPMSTIHTYDPAFHTTHEKKIAVGKSGPNATFDLFFLGLSWPWVGKFVCFKTRQNLVNLKNPILFVCAFLSTLYNNHFTFLGTKCTYFEYTE